MLVRAMSGASPLTVTSSAIWETFMETLISSVAPRDSCTPWRFSFAKPDSSKLRSYVPGGSAAKR